MTSAELRRKAAEARDKVGKIVATAEAENREINEDESSLVSSYRSEAESFDRRVKIVEQIEGDQETRAQSTGRVSEPIGSVEVVEAEEDKHRSMGDFLKNLVDITDRNTPREAYERAYNLLTKQYRSQYRDYTTSKDPEKRALVTTSGVSGGWLIPTDFRAEIMKYPGERAIVRPRARVIPMNGLEVEIPTLKSSTVPTGGSAHYGGVLMGWSGESEDKPESEPKFEQAKLVAHELSGYCAVSRTTLMKSPISVDTFLFQLFGESVAREEDRAFFRGLGGGKPVGIQTSPAVVATAARGSATAITFANATSVYTRVPPDYRGNGVWVVSQAAESAVYAMTGSANAVFHPSGVYVGDNGGNVNAGPAGVMLYMRPVLVSSLLPALNTLGDFGFYDFSQYLVGDPGLLEVATSEHYLFRKGQIAFRLIHYVGGMPWCSSPLTLDDGSTTVSPFVLLQIQ
jgi:HK97 family phage major capsid protein